MKSLLSLVALAAAVPTMTHAASPLRIYAAGSGADMFSLAETASEVIGMTGVPTPNVLYIGTATYDRASSATGQTGQFAKVGCAVKQLPITDVALPAREMDDLFAWAQVIIVSGGNTLYAVDRWNQLGVSARIREAGARGVVLAGGSAGGIVWFDGGHSDSMDPNTYRHGPGPYINASLPQAMLDKSWAYLRVPGIQAIPGLFCPHYDKIESNGVLRADSFEVIHKQHSGEYGLAVDNWAALKIIGDNYTLISRAGKPGSAGPDGSYAKSGGKPGGFVLQVTLDGEQTRTPMAREGRLADIARPARYIVDPPLLAIARLQNPIPEDA